MSELTYERKSNGVIERYFSTVLCITRYERRFKINVIVCICKQVELWIKSSIINYYKS